MEIPPFRVPLQEGAVALFSQEEKWPICGHASFKDYLSEASAFNRCTGSSEIVPTEPAGDHSGFTEGPALQAIEHVGAFSERHQHQLYGGDVLCMAGKSKECPQGAVWFHGYWKCILGKTLAKLTTLQPAATKAPALTVRIDLCLWNERVAMSPQVRRETNTSLSGPKQDHLLWAFLSDKDQDPWNHCRTQAPPTMTAQPYRMPENTTEMW